MARTPVPHPGCFTSAYPSPQWQEVPCTTAPARPYPPRRGSRSYAVGNGNDVSAQVTAGVISVAEGSFDSVTGVTSETGDVDGAPPPVANTFSLQLNSNFFSNSPSCNGASVPANCVAWEQFVFSNSGYLIMQYWLINYNNTCPAGWYAYSTDCYTNGANSASIPYQTIANLGNLRLMGEAVSGGMDTVVLSTGTALYAAQNPDSAVYLAEGWTAAEFNVVGDCCGTQAIFNSGASIVVRTSVNNGSSGAARCLAEGFTGETNNLNFNPASTGPTPEMLPAVVFTQSGASSSTAPCTYATNLAANKAATHDFNGDGKSDILWRNSDGDVDIWLMNGTQILSATDLGNAPVSWSIAGTGDFNGDGKSDILSRNTNGDVAIWLMNGNQILSETDLANAANVWTLQGVNSD